MLYIEKNNDVFYLTNAFCKTTPVIILVFNYKYNIVNKQLFKRIMS